MTIRPAVFIFIFFCIALVAPWICFYGAGYWVDIFGVVHLRQSLQQLLSWTVWLSLAAVILPIIPLYLHQRLRLRQFGKTISVIDLDNPKVNAKEIRQNKAIKNIFPFFEDISNRLKRAIDKEKGLIAELNAARDYTDLLLESVGEAIMVFDNQGRLQDFNAVSEKLFGLSAYRHVGTIPLFLAVDEDAFYRDLHAVKKEIALKGQFKGEMRIKSAEGEFIYAESTVSPVGSFSGLGRELYISAIRDVSARHKALKALEESEQRYRLVTDGSPLGIYIYQDGQLVFVNQRLSSMLETPVEDLLSGFIWDNFEPADKQAMQNKYQRQAKGLPGGPPVQELKFTTANGEEKWLEVQSSSFLLNGRPATIGNVKDITESRLARQEARSRLREIEVLGRISALANRADDLEPMLNQAMAEMNEIIGLQGGYVLIEGSYGDVIAIRCQDNTPNWLMDYALEMAEAHKNKPFADMAIESFPAPDVNGPQGVSVCRVPLESVDRPIGCLLMWGEKIPDHNAARFINSVSLELGTTVERLRLVQALRVSEYRYRDLFENAGDLIEAVDEQGRYVYVNKRWKDVLGYTEDEVESLRIKDIVDPAWLQAYRKIIEEVKAGGNVENAELVFVRKDGGQVRLEGSITARMRGGQIAYTRSMFRDVTTNRMLQEQMQRAQRIESLAIMAGGMAHDFNNVLMAVLGNISLMMSEIQPDTKMHQRLSNIEQQALAGCSVTKQLLNIARTKGPESSEFDVVGMLEGIVEVVRRTRKRLTITFDVDDELPGVKGDEGQLHQAFMNLLINAAQATNDGGRVDVKVSSQNMDSKEAQARSIEKGPYFKVQVSDDGHGIDEADLKRIFDPFFSTKDRNRGTGLGLTMTYRTIKQHNGFIGVESQKDKGATFTVLLPKSGTRQYRQESCGVSEQGRLDNIRGKTILVVDDEQGVRQAIADMLRQTGANVLEAENGRQAQKLLESGKHDVALIVLDMIMPDMDGIEFYNWLENSDYAPLVLFATGNGPHPAIERKLSSNQCHYIAKPFRLVDFNAKLAEIFSQP